MLSLSLHPSQASRSPESLVDQAPLAGSQMIQIRAKADEAVKTDWHVTYSNGKKTCHQNKILTWGARGVTNEEECQQACASWPVGQPHNKNFNKSCGAGYFFHKADGSPSCRLYETCDTCRRVGIAGFTFTSSATGCKAPCGREDCKREDGFKPKSGWQDVMCSGSQCSPSECCVKCSSPHCEKEPTCKPKDCKKEDGFKPKSDWKEIMCSGSQCSPSECCDKEPEPTEPEPTEPEPTEPEPTGPVSYTCLHDNRCESAGGDADDLLRGWQGTEEACKDKCTELGCGGFVVANEWCFFRSKELATPYAAPGLTCCVAGHEDPGTDAPTTTAPRRRAPTRRRRAPTRRRRATTTAAPTRRRTTAAPAPAEYRDTSDYIGCSGLGGGWTRVTSVEECQGGLMGKKWNGHEGPNCDFTYPSPGCFAKGKLALWLYYSNCPESRKGTYDHRIICKRGR